MDKTIIDGHCDVLDKLVHHSHLDFYVENDELDSGYARLRRGGVKVQLMAIYIPERSIRPSMRDVLQYVDTFRRKVLKAGVTEQVSTKAELKAVLAGDRLGTILTLEGVDALAGDLLNLRTCWYLGVRAVGITWNYGNWAADGVLEPRKGGFSLRGRKLIEECDRLGMILDVSHLSETGFWELAERSARPFIASHSNAKALCPHPRNLTDPQIEHMIRSGGLIGITFVPYFVKSEPPVRTADILRHIDRIASLGGVRSIAFGSDFDGIEQWVQGLENAGKYETIAEELYKHYKPDDAALFLQGNWTRFLSENLPD
ncbi:dipeptidase [Paenibacillus chartarius]|uniref:Dipeptidase n=1 Tax=Paenibacillus chartarius TaxID=747481 RepID=A0ABV6DSN4_9BACL